MWMTRFLFGGLMVLIGALALVVGMALSAAAVLPMAFSVFIVECMFIGFWIDAEYENYHPSPRGAEGRRLGGT